MTKTIPVVPLLNVNDQILTLNPTDENNVFLPFDCTERLATELKTLPYDRNAMRSLTLKKKKSSMCRM